MWFDYSLNQTKPIEGLATETDVLQEKWVLPETAADGGSDGGGPENNQPTLNELSDPNITLERIIQIYNQIVDNPNQNKLRTIFEVANQIGDKSLRKKFLNSQVVMFDLPDQQQHKLIPRLEIPRVDRLEFNKVLSDNKNEVIKVALYTLISKNNKSPKDFDKIEELVQMQVMFLTQNAENTDRELDLKDILPEVIYLDTNKEHQVAESLPKNEIEYLKKYLQYTQNFFKSDSEEAQTRRQELLKKLELSPATQELQEITPDAVTQQEAQIITQEIAANIDRVEISTDPNGEEILTLKGKDGQLLNISLGLLFLMISIFNPRYAHDILSMIQEVAYFTDPEATEKRWISTMMDQSVHNLTSSEMQRALRVMNEDQIEKWLIKINRENTNIEIKNLLIRGKNRRDEIVLPPQILEEMYGYNNSYFSWTIKGVADTKIASALTKTNITSIEQLRDEQQTAFNSSQQTQQAA